MDETNSKGIQKIIFIISLIIVLIGIIMILVFGLGEMFKFTDTSIRPLTTKQQPYFLIFIFGLGALFFSGRNLIRIKKKQNERNHKSTD